MANKLPTPAFEATTLISQKKKDIEKELPNTLILTTVENKGKNNKGYCITNCCVPYTNQLHPSSIPLIVLQSPR